jgi:hypothetical protein
VGRDVDEIVKDLMEASLSLTRTRLGEALREVAERAAEDVILAALTGAETEDMKGRFRLAVHMHGFARLRSGLGFVGAGSKRVRKGAWQPLLSGRRTPQDVPSRPPSLLSGCAHS